MDEIPNPSVENAPDPPLNIGGDASFPGPGNEDSGDAADTADQMSESFDGTTTEAHQQRNVIVFGKEKAGKSSIIKQLIKESDPDTDLTDAMKSNNVWTVITKKGTMLSIFEVATPYDKDTAEDTKEAKKLYSEVLHSEMKTRMDINLIMLVFRDDCFTSEEKEIFETLLAVLSDKARKICVLILTGCESFSDSKRRKLVVEYKNRPETRKILEALSDSICVGFPDLEDVDEEFQATYQSRIENDRKKLLQLVEESEIFVSRAAMFRPDVKSGRNKCVLS